jgi:hypothetical protein
MLRHASILLIAGATALWSAGDLFAQAPGFGGSMVSGQGGGGGGGSSFGSSGGGFGSSGGSTGLGSTGGGMSNSGLSMLNATSLSGGFGLLGFGAANGFGSGAGQSMYGGRTYGSVTSAGGASMGGSMANGGRSSSASTASSSGGRGGQSGSSSARRRTSSTTGSGAAKQQPVWFEPRMEVGFEVPPPKKSAVESHVTTSLGSSKVGSRFGGVQVSVDGETAILRGAVVSQNDRQLAEQIALLEPSIAKVRNELTVRKPATAPAASPPRP